MEKTQEMLEEEELMKRIMGFTQFDSTKVDPCSTICIRQSMYM